MRYKDLPQPLQRRGVPNGVCEELSYYTYKD